MAASFTISRQDIFYEFDNLQNMYTISIFTYIFMVHENDGNYNKTDGSMQTLLKMRVKSRPPRSVSRNLHGMKSICLFFQIDDAFWMGINIKRTIANKTDCRNSQILR